MVSFSFNLSSLPLSRRASCNDDDSGGASHDHHDFPELGLTSVSGSSAMPLDNLGKEQAAIETPRRSFSEFEDHLTRDLPANHSFTSPMNRMLSFTRMSSCQIVMTELDIELGEKKR